jgi:hypothetical protein
VPVERHCIYSGYEHEFDFASRFAGGNKIRRSANRFSTLIVEVGRGTEARGYMEPQVMGMEN